VPKLYLLVSSVLLAYLVFYNTFCCETKQFNAIPSRGVLGSRLDVKNFLFFCCKSCQHIFDWMLCAPECYLWNWKPAQSSRTFNWKFSLNANL